MNPMKDWTLVTFLGVSQSQTPVTLTRSISTWPSEMMRLRYLTLGCLKIHFSTLRYNLCFQRMSRTLTTMVWCCSFVSAEDEDVFHVDSHDPSVDAFLEDVVHHHLEVARLLVKPKNMTKGSNKPLFIQKAAFH